MSIDPAQALDSLSCTRQVRHEISAQLDHDPGRLLEYFQKVQEHQAKTRPARPAARPQTGAENKT